MPEAISLRARTTRRADVIVGFARLGGKDLEFLARKDSDLAFVSHFESASDISRKAITDVRYAVKR